MTHPCILVVDDREDNRTLYTTLLEHHGYRVLVAADGKEGVRAAIRHHPDLILMDISMPVMDGWDAMDLLGNVPETAGIPVIAFTCQSGARPRRRAREAGFVLMLPKPCKMERLLHQIEEILGPPVASAH